MTISTVGNCTSAFCGIHWNRACIDHDGFAFSLSRYAILYAIIAVSADLHRFWISCSKNSGTYTDNFLKSFTLFAKVVWCSYCLLYGRRFADCLTFQSVCNGHWRPFASGAAARSFSLKTGCLKYISLPWRIHRANTVPVFFFYECSNRHVFQERQMTLCGWKKSSIGCPNNPACFMSRCFSSAEIHIIFRVKAVAQIYVQSATVFSFGFLHYNLPNAI